MTLTWKRALIGAVVLFLAAYVLGVSYSSTETIVETITETEARTPAACIEALDYAIDGVRQTSDLFRIAATGNVNALERAAADFAEWTQENQPSIERASGECRAS